MINTKTRAGLMGIVAAYLVYTAWQLFEGRNDPVNTMPQWQMILFITLFVIAAGAIAAYAFKLWKNSGREEKEDHEDGEDGDGLKQ